MKLIVFDIDDTLTKSEYQHQTAYVNAMKEFGILEINQNWASYQHHTDSYILKENYEHNLNKAFEFSFIKDFEIRMTELMLSFNKVSEISGAKDMMASIMTQKDYAVAFATGSLLKPAIIKLQQAEIEFDEKLVVGSNQIYEREGIVQQAINQAKEFYKVDVFENIISVGDGIWDLNTAQNLDVHFMGIGMKNYADFEKAGIKAHIKDWNDFDLNGVEKIFGI